MDPSTISEFAPPASSYGQGSQNFRPPTAVHAVYFSGSSTLYMALGIGRAAGGGRGQSRGRLGS